jgi:SAM-dependent methyltransferase
MRGKVDPSGRAQHMGLSNSYDAVPYESFPYAQAHPDRLATIAALLGLRPASPARCRVLELGCAAGGNLIPLGILFPASQFVGIDLSEVQLHEGRDAIELLKLSNVELKHQDIMGLTEEAGTFDYVICHGVYSWVHAEIQERILEICSRNLAPRGVAYISYNTYPGWHMRGMIRDVMLFHARAFADPATKVRQARNLLDFLAKAVGTESSPYGALLRSEVESIRRSSDSYLFHEHLEDENSPVYFFEFAERAAVYCLYPNWNLPSRELAAILSRRISHDSPTPALHA